MAICYAVISSEILTQLFVSVLFLGRGGGGCDGQTGRKFSAGIRKVLSPEYDFVSVSGPCLQTE